MSKLKFVVLAVALTVVPVEAVYAWTKSATFDVGTLGVKSEGLEAFDGADGLSITSNEQILKGFCSKLQIKKGDTGYGNWGGEFRFPQKVYRGGTVWFLVHTYMPSGFDYHSYGEGNRLKFLRVQTLDSTGKNIGYNDLYFDMLGESNPLKVIYEGEAVWHNVGGAQDFPKKDKWESYEMAVTLDSVPVSKGGQGRIRIWKNGELLKDINDIITLRDNDAYSDRALLFTYWNGGSPADQSMYVDEITITTDTPATKDAFGNPYIGGLYLKRPQQILSPVVK